ncbi:hypothetical protein E5673_14750 [Sphingomonas sp. PAMC26645]|uniref:hypothetical protein n=1 Tax=Sphingomonas sp. PAMC26645 TaxID=2565555 RepID=UPI00109D91E6|nr:hypothetical protein [Sphingomonas sp. PAMC26645]QCB43328.1 hypothetical protein E5673_14750 [Sphingomonas sp. PAMC26645]
MLIEELEFDGLMVADGSRTNHLFAMSHDYQPGPVGNDTAIVLAVAGRLEMIAGRPAAGQTGINIDGILVHLHAAAPDVFPSTSRLDYRIVNSVAFSLYKSRDRRTMPRDKEVTEVGNLDRLTRYLADSRHIVAFSAPAELAVRSIGKEPDFHFHHPSMSRLNSLYPRLGHDRRWRVLERYRMFADAMLHTHAMTGN